MEINYQVVKDSLLTRVISRVIQHQEAGWKCVGGICFDGREYMQAMVMYQS